MTIIPKGETHGWAFAKFGEEVGDRYVVDEDLVVIPKQDYDKMQCILAEMRGNEFDDPHLDASGIIGARNLARRWADRIDAALSGNFAGKTNKKGKTMQYIRLNHVEAEPMAFGEFKEKFPKSGGANIERDPAEKPLKP